MNKRSIVLYGIVLLAVPLLQAGDFWNSQYGSKTKDLLREIDRSASNYIDQKEREMRDLQKTIDLPLPKKGNMTKTEYKAELADLESRKRDARKRLEKLENQAEWAEKTMQGLVGSFLGNMQDSMDKKRIEREERQELRKTVLTEKMKGNTLIAQEKERGKSALKEIERRGAQTRKTITSILTMATDPQKRRGLIMLTGGVIGIGSGAYYGIKFLAHVAEDLYRVPTLAEKTTIVPWYEKIFNWIVDAEQPFSVTLDDVILDKEREGFFRGFVRANKNTIDNGGFCQHLLLPGPPGTGKTLISFALANELGLPAIYFNAGKLSNCTVEDALVRIEKLFTYAANSEVPIVIIIDESEVIFKHRNSPDLSEKTRLIMNDIMAKTGTEQNNFILIALTNRPDDFDPAFKSRFSEIIYINPPSYEQRKHMLEKYIDQYLVNPTFTPKRSWKTLFKKSNDHNNKIVIGKDALTAQHIEELAHKFDTFSGRDISQAVLAMRTEAYAQANPTLDRETIERVAARKIEKKRRETTPSAAPAA